MAKFVLDHHHRPEECEAAYAAWNGFESPLRHHQTLASCASGEHRVLWTVEADDRRAALDLLPPFVAARTEVNQMREVVIP